MSPHLAAPEVGPSAIAPSTTRKWGGRLAWVVLGALSATLLCRLVSGIYDGGAAARESVLVFVTDDFRLWQQVVTALVLAPLVETMLMAVPLTLAMRGHLSSLLSVPLVASLMAGIHMFDDPAVGIQVLPAFLIFGFAFVRRSGPPHADGFWIVVAMHALYNALLVVALLILRYQPP